MFKKLCKKNGGDIKVSDIVDYIKNEYGVVPFYSTSALILLFAILLYIKGIDVLIHIGLSALVGAIIVGIVFLFHKLITSKIAKYIYSKFMNTTIIKCRYKHERNED